ncbi:tannase/feruloyl esterase family alpha/beta hydrolase [Actinocorallia populi]|uniref:tannase/feruloyl esterase family alpha/beta hydrolase n=1 Tax=Actinocorallia populi TaxID=2079200 RepID=UPI000D08A500|nr:tannase/feruloyl esterase family alpha/beta hydrolase [Actinocorallia populi]
MKRHISVTAFTALTAAGLGMLQGFPPAAAALGPDRTVVAHAAKRCASLAEFRMAAADIGLPTRGGRIDSATLNRADPASGRPEFCLVRGKVHSFDTKAPDINFQINLPTSWNRKSVQFGGAGFNGTVITGLGVAPGFGNTDPAQGQPPIDRGYATFGSDGGTSVGAGAVGSFASNEEALANWSGQSVKRTRDAAITVLKRYYGGRPDEQYHVGASKGGHEGLVAAQRYGDDYDGIIAYYPAIANQAMVLGYHRMWQQAYGSPGGYLNPAEQRLVSDAVHSTCDGLDGAADGVISHVRGCDGAFSVDALRCPDVIDGSDACLSPAQIQTLRTAASRFTFAFPMANGVTGIGPFPVLRGAELAPLLLDGAGKAEAAVYYNLIDPEIRYFIEQNADGSTANFDYLKYRKRIRELSRLIDTTDPDMDRFVRRGGKLIILQGTTDMLVPETLTDAYYERMADRYGPSIRRSVRYYVQPGFGHGTGRFDPAWDSLTALDAWTTRNTPPADPVATDANPATHGRTLPLCEYPLWPKYKGRGDIDQAGNFTCADR